MKKYDLSDFPPLFEGAKIVRLNDLLASDNTRLRRLFLQYVRDGVELHGKIEELDERPIFRMDHFFIWLFPKSEQFLLSYLNMGKSTGFPSYPPDRVFPKFEPDSDYLYKHIKREIERGKYTCNEENQKGVSGIRIIGNYPYGSLDYGFIPYTWDSLTEKLETIEPYRYIIPEYDIPNLHSAFLPIEYKEIGKNQLLDSVFDTLPTHAIIDKTICGCGATWLEIHSERNSIIIEPNVPVIIGKAQQHPHLIGVYGETLKARDIARKIQDQSGFVKIMTTPDSYPKVVQALKYLKIPYLKDYFLLFDECEKIISDIDYRQNIALPVDDFFKFQNKAMVSATPIVIDDPRFQAQQFKVVKIKPTFDYKQLLELKPTNNVNVMVKKTLKGLGEDCTICFFYNSIQGIKELIELLEIEDSSHIYCSTDAKKELVKDKYPYVFDSVTNEDGKTILNRYNFFTSRFYSAVDIELPYKPIVIMITQVYKNMADKTPYSLIDPETEAIQITGRFRNGIERLIHITNTNEEMGFYPQESLKQFLEEKHEGFLQLLALQKQVESDGERQILAEAVGRTDYFQQGFATLKGKINYFRYNNAYLDERLKMLYRYSAPLHKAYNRSGAFTIFSEAVYAASTDQERKVLNNRNNSKSKRITLLSEIVNRTFNSSDRFDHQFLEELKQEYALYIEAVTLIGLRKIKALEFKDSDVQAEVNRVKFVKQLRSNKVKDAVYKEFKENTIYTTKHIKEQLKLIFEECKLVLHRQPQGKDISFYFEAETANTKESRGWKLLKKLPD